MRVRTVIFELTEDQMPRGCRVDLEDLTTDEVVTLGSLSFDGTSDDGSAQPDDDE